MKNQWIFSGVDFYERGIKTMVFAGKTPQFIVINTKENCIR